MLKALTCRDHGGIFKVQPRRGRPPVRCTSENKCTRHPNAKASKSTTGIPSKAEKHEAHVNKARVTRKRATLAEVKTEVDRSMPVLRDTKRNLRTSVKAEAEVTTVTNPSVPPAMAAKALLIEKGWHVEGKAYEVTYGTDGVDMVASLAATRDDERLDMLWIDGVLKDQTYSLWMNGHTPEANGRPKSNLGFDPEEMTDQELVRILSGQKVTWWNRLGSNQETGTIANKVKISHTYIGGTADENPGDRVITFVDHGGGGFRSFYVSALIKVG